MNCSCDDQICEFFREKIRTAGKEHECGECQKIIPKREKYFEWVGKIAYRDNPRGGEISSFRMCLQCKEDWDTIYEIMPTDSICSCYGEIRRNIQEAFDTDLIEEDHPLILRWFPSEEKLPLNCYELAEIEGQLAFSFSADINFSS